MQDRLAVIGLKHRISPQHFQLMKIHSVRCTGSPQWTLLRKRKANLFFSSTILGLSVVKKEKKKETYIFHGAHNSRPSPNLFQTISGTRNLGSFITLLFLMNEAH